MRAAEGAAFILDIVRVAGRWVVISADVQVAIHLQVKAAGNMAPTVQRVAAAVVVAVAQMIRLNNGDPNCDDHVH